MALWKLIELKKNNNKKKITYSLLGSWITFQNAIQKSQIYESAMVPIILGIIVGFVASIMGVGGAFLMVPAMIYLIGMPVKLVPGTSLFVTIFVTAFVTISHAFTQHTIDLVLVLILITGSIAGVHAGQKTGQRLQGSELKTLLALLMLSVGFLMGYETFFRDGTAAITIPTDKIVEISDFGNTIFNLSTNYPFVYGISSIFLALVAGVAVSFIRRKISLWRSERTNKPAMY